MKIDWTKFDRHRKQCAGYRYCAEGIYVCTVRRSTFNWTKQTFAALINFRLEQSGWSYDPLVKTHNSAQTGHTLRHKLCKSLSARSTTAATTIQVIIHTAVATRREITQYTYVVLYWHLGSNHHEIPEKKLVQRLTSIVSAVSWTRLFSNLYLYFTFSAKKKNTFIKRRLHNIYQTFCMGCLQQRMHTVINLWKEHIKKIIAISEKKKNILFSSVREVNWPRKSKTDICDVTPFHAINRSVRRDQCIMSFYSEFRQKKWSEESKRKQYAQTLSFIARLNCICPKWNNCHFPNVKC